MRKSHILFLLLLVISGGLFAQLRFDIEAFSDTTKYGWEDYAARADYRSELYNRQQLLHIYELESQPLTANILKSALVPGWGQFSTNAPVKAEIIIGAEVLAMGTAFLFYDRSMNYYRKYQNASQVGEIEDYYKKARTANQYATLTAGLGLIVWIYNMYDVIVSTEEYNASVWQKILERNRDSALQITPEGLELRF
ncbi:MAG TPA: hypothetical protein PLX59_05455 [Candidatus Cloacimonadota bacterium]|nr:hypothetical protein [Candidatus Cloacimonadota bacterium]